MYTSNVEISLRPRSETPDPDDDDSQLWVIGVVLPLVVILILLVVGYFVWRRKIRLPCLKDKQDLRYVPDNENIYSMPSVLTDSSSTPQDSWLIESGGGKSTGSVSGR